MLISDRGVVEDAGVKAVFRAADEAAIARDLASNTSARFPMPAGGGHSPP